MFRSCSRKNLYLFLFCPTQVFVGETEESLRKPGVKFLQSNKITKLEPVLLVPGLNFLFAQTSFQPTLKASVEVRYKQN